MQYTITRNSQFDSLEVTFNEKPAESVREYLKSLKFRWHGIKKCWYGKINENELTDGLNARIEPKEGSAITTGGVSGDGYMGGGEWTGAEYSKRGYMGYGEINKLVKKEMQRRFPGVTFKTRGQSYSGGQSSTFYILLPRERLFKDCETIKHNYLNRFSFYWLDLPGGESVWHESATAEQREQAAEYYAERVTTRRKEDAHNLADEDLTEEALTMYQTAKSLYSSFIHDESNSMVDYFDRNLYDEYSFINTDVEPQKWDVV